ncbi:MAG: hypothetical protein AB7I30_23575 [Isosphaeraceae bacterium]
MRWRVRTLMVAVAITAMVLGAAIGLYAERRRSYYRLRVESLAWGEADVVERIAERLQAAREAEARGPEGRKDAEDARLEAEWLAKLAAWHVKLERSYMRAVEHPWEALPPDPSPPTPPPGLVRNRSPMRSDDQ